MKKVIRCLCMIALVALTITSCKKNETKTTFTARTQKLVYEGETNRAFIGDDEYVHGLQYKQYKPLAKPLRHL